MENEIYLGLTGGYFGRYWWGLGQWRNEGTPANVDFDYQLVLDRDEEHGDIIGFFHTHPMTQANPSMTDYTTMGGWTVCFGKPLVCVIKGTDGLRANWFIDDETEHIKGFVRRFGNIFVGRIPSKIRKIINGKQ
jgi:hypothetical protein